MNQQDFLSTVARYQPCTTRDLYLPLIEAGYYATKPESEAIDSISKYAYTLKAKGLLINEKTTKPTGGACNVWRLANQETETAEEPEMTDEPAEMASDVAELEFDHDETPEPVYITRVTRLTVLPCGAVVYSDEATHIEIADDGNGEYVRVYQDESLCRQGLLISTDDEWERITTAVNAMLENIPDHASGT